MSSERAEDLRARILARLVEAPPGEGATLTELARSLAIGPSTLLSHLRAMVDAGQVERRIPPGTRLPRYHAVPFLSATWSWPEKDIHERWFSAGPVSWRFPLATRIRNAAARDVLVRFLRAADARGLLVPRGVKGRALLEGRAFAPAGVSVVVYGSQARGDAGPRSDVDVLVVGTLDAPRARAWRALAAEANLWASPKLDVNVVTSREFAALSATLLDNVVADGVTVYTTDEERGFIEVLRRRRATHGRA